MSQSLTATSPDAVKPIPIGSKRSKPHWQTTNRQCIAHYPLPVQATHSLKETGPCPKRGLTVLAVEWSESLVIFCAARTADRGRSSELMARIALCIKAAGALGSKCREVIKPRNLCTKAVMTRRGLNLLESTWIA